MPSSRWIVKIVERDALLDFCYVKEYCEEKQLDAIKTGKQECVTGSCIWDLPLFSCTLVL